MIVRSEFNKAFINESETAYIDTSCTGPESKPEI